MVRHEVEHAIPEERHLRKHLALAGNARREDAVEGGYAVCGDNKQVFPEVENLPHLAAAQFFNSGKLAFEKCGHVWDQGSGLAWMKFRNHLPAGSSSSFISFLLKLVRPKFAA